MTTKIKVRIPVKVTADGNWIYAGGSVDDDDGDMLQRLMGEWSHEYPLAVYWIEAELEVPVFNVADESVTVTQEVARLRTFAPSA